MEKNKEKIKLRFIVPLGLAILVLLATCIITLHQLHNHHLNQQVQKSLNNVSRLLQNELEEDAELLKAMIGFLHKDKNLQDAWLAGDRQSLLRHASPVFEDIRSKHKVTHFYFHGLDRVNFLRVHKPQKHGDYIDRFTMNQAAGSGESAWGIELGPLGTFTLRFVYPWRIDGKLAGYIELGEEIEHITPELAEITGAELLLVINKSYLNRTGWEQGMEMLGRTGDWDQFPDFVIIDSTMEAPPSAICKEIQRHHVNHEKFLFEISTERNYLGGFVPLYDAGDTEVGEIIVLKDIKSQQASLRSLLISLIAICGTVGVLLLVFFYLYTARIEQRLKAGQQHLRASNQQLESEIIERKQAEEELRESEKRSRAWLEHSPVCTKIVDLDFNLQYMSTAGIKALAVDDITPFYGKPYPFYFYPESFRNTMNKNLERARETGEVITQEASVVDMEENELWFHSTLVPVNDDQGRIEYIIIVSIDITERKQAEEELIVFQKFAEESSHGVGWANINGNTKYMNSALCRMVGEDRPEDTYGTPVTKYYDKETQERLANEIFPSVLKEGRWIGELDMQSKGGKVVSTLNNLFVLNDSDGNPQYFANVLSDITERKQAEEEQKKTVAEMERMNRVMMGREKRVIEMKKKVNALLVELGRDPEYQSVLKDEDKEVVSTENSL